MSFEAVKIIATCPDEGKEILSKELEALGAKQITPLYMAVSFIANEELYYRSHLRLSTASQLFRVVRDGAASSQTLLYNQARRVNWHEYFSSNKTFRVDGVAGDRGEDAMGKNEISKAVRLAIQYVFKIKKLPEPMVELEEPDVVISAYVHGGRVSLSICTSKQALHKRGYRLAGHPAPLKETVASTILRMSGYDGTQNFLDAMCGSGTIAIEAAYIALNKAPQIHRAKGVFGFEQLNDFNKELWREVQDKTRLERAEVPPAKIFSSDIEKNYVAFARDNALRARVEKHIEFDVRSFFDMDKPTDTGLLCMNLPYGERMHADSSTEEAFYKEIGDTLKKKFTGWRACLLVNEKSSYQSIGLKPTRKITLLNGSIPTKLLIFDIYEGTKSKKFKRGSDAHTVQSQSDKPDETSPHQKSMN